MVIVHSYVSLPEGKIDDLGATPIPGSPQILTYCGRNAAPTDIYWLLWNTKKYFT